MGKLRTYKVVYRFEVEIKAKNIDDAKKLADEEFIMWYADDPNFPFESIVEIEGGK